MIKTWIAIVANIFIASSRRKRIFSSRTIKILLLTTPPFLFSFNADARIPEPDNIIYGTLTYNNQLATSADSELTVRFELFGNEIASYQMGGEVIGNNFVLRIPIDVLEPRTALTAWPGETGQIYITKIGVNILAGTYVVGERGTVQQMNISGFNDSDGDGMPDEWEVANGLNPNDGTDANIDSDTDGLTNLEEFQYGTNPQVIDTDGDGFTDKEEIDAGTDPLDDTSFPAVANGDINGDGIVNAADVLLAQKIVLGQLVPDAGQLQRGDVAPLIGSVPVPDGQFNVGDLIVIQRKVFGLINY